MKNKKTIIDHIVFAVKDLQQGIDQIKTLTGVKPLMGGKHLNKGTHNALLPLGSKTYLEIISVDPESEYDGQKWMAVDHIAKSTITRWALSPSNIEETAGLLNNYNSNLGLIINGERQLKDESFLRWKMTNPNPFGIVDSIPFLIDWKNSGQTSL